MGELYYTPPIDKVLNEVMEKSVELWVNNYDDTYGYVTEKVGRISNTPPEHFMSIIAMFDYQNQVKLSGMLSEEAKKEIRDRYIDGGGDPQHFPF